MSLWRHIIRVFYTASIRGKELWGRRADGTLYKSDYSQCIAASSLISDYIVEEQIGETTAISSLNIGIVCIFRCRRGGRHFQFMDSKRWEASQRLKCHTYAFRQTFCRSMQMLLTAFHPHLYIHVIRVDSRELEKLCELFSSMWTCAIRCQNDCLESLFHLCDVLIYSGAFAVVMYVEEWARCCRVCWGVVSHIVASRQSAVTQPGLVLVLWPKLTPPPWISCAVSHTKVEHISNAKKKSTWPFSGYRVLPFPLLMCARVTKSVHVQSVHVLMD